MKKLLFSLSLCFSVIPAFSQNTGLTVIAPNGGENWIIGCPATITWMSAATTLTPVKIDLYKGGVFYMTICNQTPAGASSYTWMPPYTFVPGNNFKIKITLLSNLSVFDLSDGDFSINTGSITVVAPNGGEYLQYGTTYLITWNDNLCDNVRIELWKGGSLFSVIAALTPSSGSYPWAITNSIPPGSDYKVKIMAFGLNSGTASMVYDFSDNYFTIGQGCSLIVTSPNGGEVWAKGTTHIITWTYNNTATPVKIELWKGGVYHSLINASAPGTGSCYWAIPYTIPSGNNYKVKIIALNSTAANTCYDFSDGNFSIIGPFPSVTGSLLDNSIIIYPNPAKKDLNLKFPDDSVFPVTIQVVSLTGRIVKTTVAENDPGNGIAGLTIAELTDGNYIIVVRKNGAVVYSAPFVIMH